MTVDIAKFNLFLSNFLKHLKSLSFSDKIKIENSEILLKIEKSLVIFEFKSIDLIDAFSSLDFILSKIGNVKKTNFKYNIINDNNVIFKHRANDKKILEYIQLELNNKGII